MTVIHIVGTGMCGFFVGYLLKKIINWLEIDMFRISNRNYFMEITCSILFQWSIFNLGLIDSILFSFISSILLAIGMVDLFTMQIPVIFILIGSLFNVGGIIFGNIKLSSAFWGIFIGSILPLLIMGLTWIITKRQGMGFGDIQLGLVLGVWLGPMRMAITLFLASLVSLFVWLFLSFVRGFDRDRALPFAPFLSLSGIAIYISSVYYPSFFNIFIFN